MKNKKIILFQINLSIFIYIIFNCRKSQLIFLNIKKKNTIFLILLKYLFSFQVKFEHINISKIFINSENVRYYSVKKMLRHSKAISSEIIKKDNILLKLNNHFKSNIILNYIHYAVYYELSDLLTIIFSIENNYKFEKLIIYESKFTNFDKYFKKILSNEKNSINIKRNSKIYFFIEIFLINMKDKIKNFIFKFIYINKNNINFKTKKKFKNLLSFQEDTYPYSDYLRSQPNWTNLKDEKFRYNLLINNNLKFGVHKNLKIPKNLLLINLKEHSSSKFNKKFNIIIDDKIRFIKENVVKTENLYLYKILIKGLIESKKMNNVFQIYNIDYFLYGHYSPWIFSALLCKNFLKFKTIYYQYTHLNFFNPSMILSEDYNLLFSKSYKKFFNQGSVNPKTKFYEIGYHNEWKYLNVIKKNSQLKKNISLKNKINVGYFDENITPNISWTIDKKNEILIKYKKIFHFLKKNNEFCFIFKSQFNSNNLNNLFKNDEDFKKLLKQKKILVLNLKEDRENLRNNVLSINLAYLSDILICNKFSGTAAIESAIIGKPVIFLNEYKVKHYWDSIYKKKVNEFVKIEDLFKYLIKNKNKKKELMKNNKWNSIINNFSNRSYKNKDYGYKNLFRANIKKIIEDD